ncbi:MAG: hypothetical protein J0H88_16370 [Sphingomonadales bacterium]|nr:hypothetical protein [Sphingomonadales bacterium]
MLAAPLTDVVIIRADRFKHWLPQLVDAVAAIGGITPEQLVAPGKMGWAVRLRAAFTIAAVDVMEKKWAEIARAMGGRNHGSMINAYAYAQRRMETDPEFRQLVNLVLAIARAIVGQQVAPPVIEPELPL